MKREGTRLEYLETRKLADAEGNLLDDGPSEAVLQAGEDFFPSVTDDFTEPDIAVHGDE